MAEIHSMMMVESYNLPTWTVYPLLTFLFLMLNVSLVAVRPFLGHVKTRNIQRPKSNLYPDTISPPCQEIIVEAEAHIELHGHENRGPLSRESGFTPRIKHRTSLPERYNAWENIASNIDSLICTQQLRSVVDALPKLPAGQDSLPDIYLQRAATILGIIAHSYVRMFPGTHQSLPDYSGPASVIPSCLEEPWNQVCRRLGRNDGYLTYEDFINANFFHEATGSPKDISVDRIKFVVPTKMAREDYVFYGVMFEIAAVATPVLNAVINAQSAVLSNDNKLLKNALQEIRHFLHHIRYISLPKLSPKAGSSTYVDPILWVKSVADFAVPWKPGPPGPSGTAHPFFHLMDCFIGRSAYSTRLGKEAKHIRNIHPLHWQKLFLAVEKIHVANYIETSQDKVLQDLWSNISNLYTGPQGILGFHRRKVYGYLFTAFRVGRSKTINGFRGNSNSKPWEIVADALEKSRQERKVHTTLEGSEAPLRRSLKKGVPVSSLIKHVTGGSGYWIAARQKVFDVTRYLSVHPGGHIIIKNCCGRDVTEELSSVSHISNPAIWSAIEKFCIGELQIEEKASPAIQRLYDLAVALGYTVADTVTTYENHTSYLRGRLTGHDQPGEASPLKRNHFIDCEEHLKNEVTVRLANFIMPVLTALEACLPRDKVGEAAFLLKQSQSFDQVKSVDPTYYMNMSLEQIEDIVNKNKGGLGNLLDFTAELLQVLESLPEERVDLRGVSAAACWEILQSELAVLSRLRA